MRGMGKRVSFSIDGTTYDSIEERVTGKLNRFFGETEYSYAWDARPDPDSDYGAYRVHVTAVVIGTEPTNEPVILDDPFDEL